MARCLGRYPQQFAEDKRTAAFFLDVANLICLAGVVVRGANEKVRSLYSAGIRTQ
jgi:hypothetical protein